MSQYITAKTHIPDDTNFAIAVLDPTDEAMDGYKNRRASTTAVFGTVNLNSEHVKALLTGKALAVDNGEFVMFLVLPNPETFNLIRVAE